MGSTFGGEKAFAKADEMKRKMPITYSSGVAAGDILKDRLAQVFANQGGPGP